MKSQIEIIFTNRKELSFWNIRIDKWAAILVFPLAFILCNTRHFDIETTFFGLKSSEIITFTWGFGWLTLFFLPKRLIIPVLKISALICTTILPFQIILSDGLMLLAMFAAFQFFIGICLGASFYIFCFTLNNAERLLGMFIISFCSALFYHILSNFYLVTASQKTGRNFVIMILYLVVIFSSFRKKDNNSVLGNTFSMNNKESVNMRFDVPIFLVILLVIANQLMRLMMNDMALARQLHQVSYALGTPAAIMLILAIHFYLTRKTLYSWLLSIIFSLLGISLLLFDSSWTFHVGSFVWGLGNILGYITTFFLCSGAIKQLRSLKMYRIFTLIMFAYHALLRGILFNLMFPHLETSPSVMAFAIVLALSCICFAMLPYLQRKIFDSPWADGLKLANTIAYVPALEGTEPLNEVKPLRLSPREKEIFLLLLGDSQRKHIADTLKIGNGTVNFHINNLYKKLGIQSRIELFAKYGKNKNVV
jgi:DNA-binding CsgD family transcriptional regulator